MNAQSKPSGMSLNSEAILTDSPPGKQTSASLQENRGNPSQMAEINQIGKRVQELVERVEAWPDPAARALVRECLQSVLGFYEQGLMRILQVVEEADTGGGKVYKSLIDDNVVCGLLLIHGLHPEDL